MSKALRIPFNAPLHQLDTENCTYGCRMNNPDICNSNLLESICAFVSSDNICKKPSRTWKKQYERLSSEK